MYKNNYFIFLLVFIFYLNSSYLMFPEGQRYSNLFNINNLQKIRITKKIEKSGKNNCQNDEFNIDNSSRNCLNANSHKEISYSNYKSSVENYKYDNDKYKNLFDCRVEIMRLDKNFTVEFKNIRKRIDEIKSTNNDILKIVQEIKNDADKKNIKKGCLDKFKDCFK
jgi:hypothetical protein